MSARLNARRRQVTHLLVDLTSWAEGQGVHALVLVGSYARGDERMASDVDVVVVVLAEQGEQYDPAGRWFQALRPGARLVRTAAWGPVDEQRYRLRSGLLVEVDLTFPDWARIPLDSGTAHVLGDGHHVLHDPHATVAKAGAALAARAPTGAPRPIGPGSWCAVPSGTPGVLQGNPPRSAGPPRDGQAGPFRRGSSTGRRPGQPVGVLAVARGSGHALAMWSTSGADNVAQDRWARWILEARFGSNPEQREQVLQLVGPIRDTVLAGANLQLGDTVLEVGCGDGLLGFGAMDRVGPTGRVVFSDLSADLLAQCARLLQSGGDVSASTLETALPDLTEVQDAFADAVVLRSVLIYVTDKARAFRALHRVLRPGGRLSLFEPINSFGFPEPDGSLWGFDVRDVPEAVAKVKAAYARTVDTGDGDPMLGFDERDLLRWAEQAGFTDITLDHHVSIMSSHPSARTDLQTYLASSPNPMVGSFAEQLQAALTPIEVQQVTELIDQALRSGRGQQRQALTYLTATKAI